MLNAFTHTEISDFDLSLGIEQDIFWFDVPMQRMTYIMDIEQTIENLFKRNGTLYVMTASSSSVITSFFFATKSIKPFKEPISMY